jgi:NitT/TauT family transport system ATP-binding protein
MDEPFGAVDAQTRQLLQEELLELWQRERKTVIFITHSMDEAVYLSDRVVVMTPRPGQVAEVLDVPLARPRNAEAVRRDPKFVELTNYIWESLKPWRMAMQAYDARCRHDRGIESDSLSPRGSGAATAGSRLFSIST